MTQEDPHGRSPAAKPTDFSLVTVSGPKGDYTFDCGRDEGIEMFYTPHKTGVPEPSVVIEAEVFVQIIDASLDTMLACERSIKQLRLFD